MVSFIIPAIIYSPGGICNFFFLKKKKKDIFPMLATVPEARVSQAMEIIQILSQQNISQSHREGFGVCYKSISQVHL